LCVAAQHAPIEPPRVRSDPGETGQQTPKNASKRE
jgi:hypothetical protein